ncbi:unnamed protein product [Chondrus crispus]|uniref:Uncharacterized protein n=1 Tax=Chondrus crispus TaxID=2769 RepID=R7QLS9_CHOCR|nr:unnamed protein product [Chondrus crispus]CDF38738.1 unnamed protein product [Chondrus crispus]|eukprot:XP_005718643.1 unnamed protein product [Chondrus crispus]
MFGSILSRSKWRDTLLFGILLLVVGLLLFSQQGLHYFSTIPTFAGIDTVSNSNWTRVATTSASLTHVYQDNLLHHKVWIVPFDDMWHIGLSELAWRDSCRGSLGAVESHVTSGASIASVVSEVAGRMRRMSRVGPLIPLGRPFLLKRGSEQEVVHVFALIVQDVFSRRQQQSSFTQVIKPVQLMQDTSTPAHTSEEWSKQMQQNYCSAERARWLGRAVSYAMRRFNLKGLVPKSNPMEDARHNDALCCRRDIDETEDLLHCALPCDGEGLYNIISRFPQT